MARYVTFKFDDGFIDGARKISPILHPCKASFFIVTGLVCGTHRLDHMPLFANANFGSIEDWRALSALGHDIQPHSVTHANFSELSDDQRKLEVEGSVAAISRIHPGPYIFGFPYNIISPLDLASLGVSASGFVAADSSRPIAFNNLDDPALDIFRLRTWAVRERHFDTVAEQLRRLPDSSWTILAFHSLDGEGHEPWTSAGFSRLVSVVRAAGLEVVSVRDMIKLLTSPRETASVVRRDRT